MAFNKFDYALMNTAYVWSDLSHSKIVKVGCVIAKDNRIITHGYNGMPTHLENECEAEDGKSKPEVIHAEHNAILFAAKNGISLNGCTAYITHFPCLHCASMLIVTGIKTVVYNQPYISRANGASIDVFVGSSVKLICMEKTDEKVNRVHWKKEIR